MPEEERGTGARTGTGVPKIWTVDAMSEVLPGQGKPTAQELKQWREGTLARFPCCHRVQPCGLIYCLYCRTRQAIEFDYYEWPKTADVAPEEVPGDVSHETSRLCNAVRAMRFGQTRGRSTAANFAARTTELLRWRQSWINSPMENIRKRALRGDCSEVSRSQACMPWEPTEPTQLHPNLHESLRMKARETGTFDQEAVDTNILLAMGLRILEEWKIDSLPKGMEGKPAKDYLMEQLSIEIASRLEDAVPFALKKQASRKYTKHDVPEDLRAQLRQSVSEEQEAPEPKSRPWSGTTWWQGGSYTGAGSSSSASSWRGDWRSHEWRR